MSDFDFFMGILQSIKFDHVRVQAGSDATGVATDMITLNSTLKFAYRNTGTFFGVHFLLSSTPPFALAASKHNGRNEGHM